VTVVIRKQCEECRGTGYFRHCEDPECTKRDLRCEMCDGRGSVEHDEPEEDEALCRECGGLLVGATS
jgi:DnaJ-class molecular chaperone